ncbi:helix-turn-helix transcriptional regulator [Gynuella sunshinyii]|uniref:AraC-type DNA-binding domain-containing protein n=1 Tax=Gynuella sunshinyii YC6258 TaxID=1445510 RepID=A0A0C5VHP5_9GAMM|nr:AraC family transcriptional regulator [Gynuella sunshinyii]AJQ93751.1 araC-type DNA-binding domain-containing protein [Gynuella sunshinyii YC6258]
MKTGVNMATATSPGYRSHIHNADWGRWQSSSFQCDNGLVLTHSQLTLQQPWQQIRCQRHSERRLVMTYAVQGYSEFQDEQGHCLRFESGQLVTSVYRNGIGQRSYPRADNINQLRLVVTESALQRYIGESRCAQVFGPAMGTQETFRLLNSETAVSEQLQALAIQPMQLLDGLSRRAMAFSWLAEQLQRLDTIGMRRDSLNPGARQQLNRITGYIREHLDHPLAYADICRACAVSEYQLKSLFRQLLHTTPGQYVLHLRMQQARQLLAEGYRVAQVAYRVGYAHPNNFTAAYRRIYGHSPRAYDRY